MSAVFYNPATGQVFTPRHVPSLRERSRSNDSHLTPDVGHRFLESLLARPSSPARRRRFNTRDDLLTTFGQPREQERIRIPERNFLRDLAGPPESFDARNAIPKVVVGNEEASALFRSALCHALRQENFADKERQEQTRAPLRHRTDAQRSHAQHVTGRRRLHDRANLARERGELAFRLDDGDADERDFEYDARPAKEESSPALASFFRNINRETPGHRISKEDENQEADISEEEYCQLLRRAGEVARIRSFVELEEQRLASRLRQSELLRYRQRRQEDLQARIKHANEERNMLSKEAEELISAVELRRERIRTLEEVVREAEERLQEFEAMDMEETTRSLEETSRSGRISPGEPLSTEETAIVREMTKAHTDRDFRRDEKAHSDKILSGVGKQRDLTIETQPQRTIQIRHEPRKIQEKETIVVRPLWKCQHDAEEKRDTAAQQIKARELHSLLQEETQEAKRNAKVETEGVIRKFQMEQQPEEKGRCAYVGDWGRKIREDSGTDILPRDSKNLFLVPPTASREGIDEISSTASTHGSVESSPKIVPVSIRPNRGTTVRKRLFTAEESSDARSEDTESASSGSTEPASEQPSPSESEWARKREAAAEKIGNFVRNRIETASDRQKLQHLRSLAEFARQLEELTESVKPAAFADPITFSVWEGSQDELPRLDQSGILPPGVHVNPCHHDFLRYESSLNKLLQGVDQIESAGHDEIREKRKRLVEKVQDHLGSLDARKRDAWNEFKKSESRLVERKRSEEDRPVDFEIQTKSEPTTVQQSQAESSDVPEARATSEAATEEKFEKDETAVSETRVPPEPTSEKNSDDGRPEVSETQVPPEPATEEKTENVVLEEVAAIPLPDEGNVWRNDEE